MRRGAQPKFPSSVSRPRLPHGRAATPGVPSLGVAAFPFDKADIARATIRALAELREWRTLGGYIEFLGSTDIDQSELCESPPVASTERLSRFQLSFSGLPVVDRLNSSVLHECAPDLVFKP